MKKHRLKLSVAVMALMIAFCARAQTLTIGTGTTQSGATATSPINNNYESHHCQILYTAAEINAGGLTAAGTITQLGFYVTVAPANALPNYTIKLKNTSATNAVTYDGNGLTQVHNIASYMPGTGGFQMLTLTTPFVWDGTSNLLVDVCFDQAAGNGGSGRCRIFTPSPTGTHYSYTRNDGVGQCGVPTNADDGNFNDYGTKGTKPQLSLVYTAPPACVPPTILPVSGITSTGANISWTIPNPAPAGGYAWEIVAAGTGTAGTAVASGSVLAGVSTATATGLSPNTAYDLYVVSYCGGVSYSAFSGPYSFSTLCSSTNVPYMVNLAAATPPGLPNCTTVETLNAGNTWVIDPGGLVNGFNNNTLTYMYNSSVAADTWFYTQGLNLTAGTSYRLSYKYANDGGTSWTEKMNVNYGTSALASAMTNTLVDHPNIIGAASPLIDVIDFVPPSTGVYYIGFHAYSDMDEDVLVVDSIIVDLTPTCTPPSSVTLSAITPTGVAVSWNAPPIGTPSNYTWEVRTSGAPGSGGAVATGTVAAPGLSVTVTGLTPGTTYYVYVKTDCGGGDISSWSTGVNFTAPCFAANIPYTMDFVNVTAPALPTCVTAETLNSGNIWETVNAPGYGFNGNAMVYSWNSSLPADTWFYTQGLNLTGGVSYKLVYRYNAAGTTYVEDMNVNYGNAPVASAMTTMLTNHNSIANAATPYVDVVSFTPATTGVYYVGFHAYSAADQFDLFVDSVQVDLCVAPTVSVAASSNTICATQSATLTASGATSYVWNTSATTSSISVSPANSTTYTLTGTDVCGTGTTTAMITVNPLPTLTVTASSTTACSAQSLTLTATGAASSYSWSSGGSTATEVVNAPTTTSSTLGVTFVVTGTNACGTGTAAVTVTVNPSPSVTAAASSTLLCSGGSATLNGGGATNYTWTAGSPTGSVVATTSTVSVSPGTTTTYYVSGDNGGCPGTAAVTITVTTCTGVQGIAAAGISVYPNPVNDVLVVSIPNGLAADNAFIDVYDAIGKMVIQKGLDTITTTVNTSTLEPGIYIYKIHNNNTNVQIGKIVKQ